MVRRLTLFTLERVGLIVVCVALLGILVFWGIRSCQPAVPTPAPVKVETAPADTTITFEKQRQKKSRKKATKKSKPKRQIPERNPLDEPI